MGPCRFAGALTLCLLTVAVAEEIRAGCAPPEVVVEDAGEASDTDSVNLLQAPGSAQVSQKTSLIQSERREADPKGYSFGAAVAEFVAMTLFVIIGPGSAMGVCGEAGWVLQVSMAFGLAITSLAYAIGVYSGGQINCAVTLGLVLAGKCSIIQGLFNFAAQVLGSLFGAAVLTVMCPEESDKTKGLGSNRVQEGKSWYNALIGEILMTFMLMLVVLETAVKAKSDLAAVAIGFAVFLAHSVMIPIDGCSINPTRSLGPAVIRKLVYKNSGSLEDMWIFWLGPMLGAAAASFVSARLVV